MRRLLGLLTFAVLLAGPTACGGGGSGGGSEGRSGGGAGGEGAAPASSEAPATNAAATAATTSGRVDVFAAASLTEAFKAAEPAFEAGAGVDVVYNFAGSSSLVTQIQQGAPADVFASADQANMDELVQSGDLSGTPEVFVANELQIVVAAGNPEGLAGLADLTRPGLTIALCAPQVPAGRYAAEAFRRAGVEAPPSSQEPDVKSVVNKVALGEADAGVVYATDVRAGGAKVAGVEVPDAQNVVAQYPVATLKEAKNAEGARAFVAYLRSPEGQQVLERFGFLPVPG